jgi:hypothetical protein
MDLSFRGYNVYLMYRLEMMEIKIDFSAIKGSLTRIFSFKFFSWISFPRAPEYPIKTVSIFFEI